MRKRPGKGDPGGAGAIEPDLAGERKAQDKKNIRKASEKEKREIKA